MSGSSIILGRLGDPIEREAVSEHGLGESFPRYAEFWALYVLPNRDVYDSSKLRSGFPSEIEDIFNSHYSVLYQLTIIFRQIRELSRSEPCSALDISDPFYHLGTAVDMIERTLVLTFRAASNADGKSIFVRITEDEYNRLTRWDEKDYKSQFKQFEKNLRPVNITLHSTSQILKEWLEKSVISTDFETLAQTIRGYRNVFTHNLTPIKLEDDSGLLLPKAESLNSRVHGRWSSGRSELDPEHFALGVEIIRKFADDLVRCANGLWALLLATMKEIAESEKYRDEFNRKDRTAQSGASQMSSPPPDIGKDIPHSGGTAVYSPPAQPSGYGPVTPSGEKRTRS